MITLGSLRNVSRFIVRRKNWILLINLIFILTLILTSLRQFSIWSQVYDYFGESLSLNPTAETDSQFDVAWFHAPRAYLVFPVFFLRDLLGISANYLFSIEVILVLALTAFLGLRLIKAISSTESETAFMSIGYAITLSGASFFMNGRLAFAQLSFALIAITFLYSGRILTDISRVLLASWFAMVSSGISLLFFVALLLQIYLLKDKKRRIALLVSLLPLLIYVLTGVYKNLLFFGWSVIGLLTHGFGFAGLLLILLGAVGIYFLYKKLNWKIRLKYQNNLEVFLVLLSVASLCLSILGRSIFWGAINIHLLMLIILQKRVLERHRNNSINMIVS